MREQHWSTGSANEHDISGKKDVQDFDAGAEIVYTLIKLLSCYS